MPGVPYPSSRAQSERTIAVARVVLAAAALFAVWLDPAEPMQYADETFTLYWIYVLYSACLALAVFYLLLLALWALLLAPQVRRPGPTA